MVRIIVSKCLSLHDSEKLNTLPEADILGDRIAIMAEGQLRCAGSSLFLKKHYGVGYQLTIEKNAKIGTATSNVVVATTAKNVNAGDATLFHESEEFSCDVDVGSQLNKKGNIPQKVLLSLDSNTDRNLENIVTSSVPEATLLSNVGTEMSFQLPIGASSKFTPMFEQLDQEVENSRIVTYGVSITTLDEVFLLVARGETGEKVSMKSSSNMLNDKAILDTGDKSYRSQMDLESTGRFIRHVQALFRKRALNFKRDKKAWVCSTLLPSLMVLVGFILYKFASPDRNLDSLQLSINSFNPSIRSQPRIPIPFNEPGSEFTCQPGRCMVLFNGSLLSSFVNGTMNETDIFTFCGLGVNGNINGSCSISESSDIMGHLTSLGAEGIPQNNVNISTSSYSIFESSTIYEGSQFGALQFTHDSLSQTDGQNYSSLAVSRCKKFLALIPQPFYKEEYCEKYGGVGYVVNYNYTALHSSLIFQALADELLMKEATKDDDLTISANVHPLPLTKAEVNLGKAEDAFNAWFLVVLSFPFIAGTFATFIVNERSTKAKHLQTVAGVEPISYWTSSYLWDVMNYQLPLVITIILMFAFDIDAFTTSERGVVGGSIITLVLFGPAAAGCTYCMTFAFTSASMCNLFVIIFNFLIGMAGPLVTFILRIIGDPSSSNNPSLINAAIIIEWILRFIPSFNLGSALLKIISMETLEAFAGRPITVWDKEGILYEVIYQAIWCIVYIVLAMNIDRWSTNPRIVAVWQSFVRAITCRWMCMNQKRNLEDATSTTSLDEDVIKENNRVAAGHANDDLIVIDKLTKIYDNGKVAVNDLSLGIPPGQCFGLLGINGAG
jgi:ATP-binding cassette, subfamily A (ABC1), member 3